jgi:gliding motility-associated lipoprotein GldD
VLSCGSDPIPKPKALLRLDYPAPEYASIDLPIPFTFEKNTLATDISEIKIARDGQSIGIDLNYPLIKGTVFITYKEVKNNINLLLLDAQELTQKHTQKADEITSTPYVDSNNRVFGMFYEVGGNAASQSQFYVTDSLNHFVTGSLYFYAKPNYDSILPAAHYLKNDIRHIMETIKWKQ